MQGRSDVHDEILLSYFFPLYASVESMLGDMMKEYGLTINLGEIKYWSLSMDSCLTYNQVSLT